MLNKKKNSEAAAENEAAVNEEAAKQEAAEAAAQEAEQAEAPAEDIPHEEVNPLAEELEKAKDNYLRLAAEYENYRKRTQREKEAITADVKANTAGQLLPILDNLERALSFDEASSEDIRKGVEMVMQQALGIFEKLGITAFCEPGDTFDPNIHNCIGMTSVEGFESGQITLVVQKGYMLDKKLIRPAMVQVAE